MLQLAICSPLLPLATAMAAWMDGDHSVCFVARPGEVHLELRHARGTGPLAPMHHHGATTRALLVFSEPASPSDPDHILEFASGQLFSRETRASLRGPTVVEEALWRSNAGMPIEAFPNGTLLLAGLLPQRAGFDRSLSGIPASTPSPALTGTVVLLI
jgi:hypothetical protein